MSKITKQEAAEIADACRNRSQTRYLRGRVGAFYIEHATGDSTVHLDVSDVWLNKADLTSIIRVLKAVKATLP